MTSDESAAILTRLRGNLDLALSEAIDDITKACAVAEAPEYTAPVVTWPFASNDAHPGAQLDAALWQSAPVECVPRHAPFEPLAEHGHRILVATDGLWLECSRPWLHLIWPLAPKRAPVALPYGELKPTCHIAFGKLDTADIRTFTARARSKLPNETGAWMSWEYYDAITFGPSAASGRLVWEDSEDISATPTALDHQRPPETETHSPCIDFHSHGTGPAGFSAIDDADDAGEVKIAVVVGNVDQQIPSLVARLCCLGLTIPLAADPAKVFSAEVPA
jgi:PRTRC genetic system protein A